MAYGAANGWGAISLPRKKAKPAPNQIKLQED